MNRLVLISVFITLLMSCKGSENRFDASGNFEATEVIISSEANGKIVLLAVEEGSRVKAGQLLAIVDSTQLDLNKKAIVSGIEAMRSTIPDVNLQLSPLNEQLNKLRADKQRLQKLFEGDVASQKSLDDINSAIEILEKQIASQKDNLNNNIRSLKKQIEAKQAELARVEDMIDRCYIKSPINGTVLTKYSQQGELTGAGRALVKVADTEKMFLRAYFTSEQLASIKIGSPVSVTADFGGDAKREYAGEIVWISDKNEFTPKNIVTSKDRADLVYPVKIAVKNDGYIKIGLYGKVILK